MDWIFFVAFLLVGGLITDLVEKSRKRTGNEPMDLPPLLAGSSKFTSPVRAVTGAACW